MNIDSRPLTYKLDNLIELTHLVFVTKSIYIGGINVMPDAKVTELKTQLMLTSLSDL